MHSSWNVNVVLKLSRLQHCGIVLLAAVHRHGSVWMQGPCLRSVASQLDKQYNRQQAPRPTRAATDAGPNTAQRSGGAIGALGGQWFVQRAGRASASTRGAGALFICTGKWYQLI